MGRDEVRAVLSELSGTFRLMGLLLYGSGLRLTECLELRIEDLDLERRQIIVRRGTGDKDRAVGRFLIRCGRCCQTISGRCGGSSTTTSATASAA